MMRYQIGGDASGGRSRRGNRKATWTAGPVSPPPLAPARRSQLFLSRPGALRGSSFLGQQNRSPKKKNLLLPLPPSYSLSMSQALDLLQEGKSMLPSKHSDVVA